MQLDVKDRLMTLGILDGMSGNFVTLKIVRALQDELSFSETEISDMNLSFSDGGAYWDDKKEGEPKDIEFGERATEIMVTALKQLDGAEKLTQEHISLYEKFIGDDL